MRKVLLLAIFGLVLGTINASPRIYKANRGGRLLGSKECTWGPSFWCGSLANAKDCNAVRHCIQTVWEHQKPKVDNDGVCKICLDMVQQARDQLRSNETQEELKEVFEGSCALIHVKAIVKECDKLVDDFIPELIEALTSQMDPHVVCSVAGLCNNAHIDRLLLEHEAEAIKKIEKPELTCDRCHSLVDKMHDKFHASRENDVLNTLLYVCGRIGSFSDSCSSIILTYFKDIYQHLESSFTGKNVCHMAGVCSARYHTHESKAIEGIEITPLSAVGVVEIESDDLPCDLCKQLVNHLKDILIANTTEIEFKEVMEGLCKQTGTFKKECLSLVDEYYDKAYQFLVSELDACELCSLAEICPKNVALGGPWKSIAQADDTPIWPLLSAEVAAFTLKTYSEQQKPRKLSTGPRLSASEINAMQLPPSRYMPQVLIDEPNRYCVFCEYFLHFVQEAISSPKNEDEIKKVVEHLCDKLPRYVTGQCKDFVSVYGDAFIALFVQEIDPSKVCPGLKVCSQKEEVRNVEVFMHPLPNDKSTCPMCLLAITTIENQIKSNKSKAAIENALNNLCKHLPNSLSPECTDLVESYYNEIIEMLVKEFNPQEVCVYIKFCTDTKPDTSLLEVVIPITKSVQQQKELDIMTNEIQDNTVNGIPKYIGNQDNISENPTCVVCKYAMEEIQDKLKDKATEEEIMHLVENICTALPKRYSSECDAYINQYGDLIIKLLVNAVDPKSICSMLGLCTEEIKLEAIDDVVECAVCQGAVLALGTLQKDPTVDQNEKNLLKKVCHLLPAKHFAQCKEMIDIYGISFIHLVNELIQPNMVCTRVGLCAIPDPQLTYVDYKKFQRHPIPYVGKLGSKECTWGPSYWCANKANANLCGALQHCQDKVWGQTSPLD